MLQLQEHRSAADATPTHVTLLAGQIEMRPLAAGDVDAIVDCSTGHIAAKRPFIVESFGRRTMVGAFYAGALTGYLIWDRGFFSRPFIWLLGVAPAFRRRGIASSLVREFVAECPREGLFTSTNDSNAAMQAMLRQCGFKPSGRVENLDPGDPEIFYFKAPARA